MRLYPRNVYGHTCPTPGDAYRKGMRWECHDCGQMWQKLHDTQPWWRPLTPTR